MRLGDEPGRNVSTSRSAMWQATPRWCRAWSRHGIDGTAVAMQGDKTGTPSAPTPDRIAAAVGMAVDTETRPTSAGAEEREECEIEEDWRFQEGRRSG